MTISEILNAIKKIESKDMLREIRKAVAEQMEVIMMAERIEKNRLAWSSIPLLEEGMIVYLSLRSGSPTYRRLKHYTGRPLKVIDVDKVFHQIVLEDVHGQRLVLTTSQCLHLGLTLKPTRAALENALKGEV